MTYLARVAQIVFLSFAIAGSANAAVSSWNGRTGAVVPQPGDYDPSQINYTPPGGTSTTPLSAKLREVINVMDYGAVGDGVTDDAADIQLAINACTTTGAGVVFFPVGNYKIGQTLNIAGTGTNSPCVIEGAGPYLSVIKPISTITAIGIYSQGQCPTFRDLGIDFGTSMAASGAAGIRIAPTTGECNHGVFENIRINFASTGIAFGAAAYWTITHSLIQNCGNAILVQNTVNTDEGDSTITSSILNNSGIAAPNWGVIWKSSGGLRISNTKILGFSTSAVTFQFNGDTDTGDLFVNNSSLEATGGTNAAIQVSRTGTTHTLAKVMIEGNEVLGYPGVVSVAADSSQYLTQLLCIGNTFTAPSTGSPVAYQVASTSGIVISNNTASSSNSSAVLINTASSASNAVIGPNMKIGSWAANSILSSSTTTIAPN